jgi:ABC-2 type transport system ATP-binding protein
MKQKIALIRALIHDPPVLFLDEPTTAMDPHSARTVRDAIADLRAARRTILLTTHNLTEAETLADRIAIVRGGRIVAEGTIAQLTRQLMGDPVWELRLAARSNGGVPTAGEVGTYRLAPMLDDLVRVEAAGDDWLRYRCVDPQHVNPQIIARLAAQRLPIVALTEVPRSLEDVYLSIVDDGRVERGAWNADGDQRLEIEDWRLEAMSEDNLQSSISHLSSEEVRR